MEIITQVCSTARNPDSPLLILLHGWGSNENDLPGLVNVLDFDIDYVSPRAPFSLPYANGYAWFENPVVERAKRKNEAKLSGDIFLNWLKEQESAGEIDPQRKIILLGFSQGGAMVTHLLNRAELASRLSAVVMLSGYLPFDADDTHAETPDIPVFHGWGTLDTIVEPAESERAKCWFKNNYSSVVDVNYPMDHSICLEEVQEISRFLKVHLS
ncbi:MAG: hypothetical protein LBQ41_01265 [Candidatus Ancillula sp.]|nr:hypothetical protein [Candidatus Ancillula sp.]